MSEDEQNFQQIIQTEGERQRQQTQQRLAQRRAHTQPTSSVETRTADSSSAHDISTSTVTDNEATIPVDTDDTYVTPST